MNLIWGMFGYIWVECFVLDGDVSCVLRAYRFWAPAECVCFFRLCVYRKYALNVFLWVVCVCSCVFFVLVVIYYTKIVLQYEVTNNTKYWGYVILNNIAYTGMLNHKTSARNAVQLSISSWVYRVSNMLFDVFRMIYNHYAYETCVPPSLAPSSAITTPSLEFSRSLLVADFVCTNLY